MTTEMKSSAHGIAWNLGTLFASVSDPQIDVALAELQTNIKQFAERYRGTINVAGVSAAHIAQALREYESLMDAAYRLSAFAQLSYAADTTSDANRALVQRIEEAMTQLRNQLVFFDLEWLQLDEATAQRIIADPAAATYQHHLRAERKFKPHTLSEPEEKIINDKNLTGISAWQKLFTEYSSGLKFPAVKTGEARELNMSEILVLMRDPSREVRQRAHETFYARLRENSQVLTFIYDTRFQDHLVSNRLRGYDDPMTPRHLANDVGASAVQTMMSVVERNFPLAQRYFKLKARLLGLPKLELYDQYAPLFEVKEKIEYARAQQIVLDAVSRFSGELGSYVSRFFEEDWIDADPRNGKRGGAFCAGVTPSTHPYILMSYNDDLRDVMTLAHELGHGIHDCLASQQTLLNYHPSLPVAETASVFSEMLVFNDLLKTMRNDKDRLALICAKLEDSFATVFRQTVLTRFEQLAYAARAKGRLTTQQIGELWLQANAPYYGDALNMTSGYEFGWSYIPHFINTPFYCYAYSFGELLVLALYGIYQKEGESFVPRYRALLASGGSLSPRDQLAAMNIDINDAAFWQTGFDALARMIAEAERLA
jgi:oligoendopeptidase F